VHEKCDSTLAQFLTLSNEQRTLYFYIHIKTPDSQLHWCMNTNVIFVLFLFSRSIYFPSELLLPMVTCNEEVPSNNFFMVTTDFALVQANTTGNVAFPSWKSEYHNAWISSKWITWQEDQLKQVPTLRVFFNRHTYPQHPQHTFINILPNDPKATKSLKFSSLQKCTPHIMIYALR
jgi:hypothetical protein